MGFLYTLLAETLTNIQTVKAFGMERYERRRYHVSGKAYFARAMRIMFFTALGRASGEFMGMTIICLAITAGAFLVLHPEAKIFGVPIMNEPLSYSSLLAFFALLAGVSDPARKMSEVMGTLQRGVAAADRVFEILDCESKIARKLSNEINERWQLIRLEVRTELYENRTEHGAELAYCIEELT